MLLSLTTCCCPLSPHSAAPCAFFQEEDDYDVMQDPEFLQSVLENLPGVDPNNAAIRSVMGALASQATKDGKNDKKEEEKK
jgi:26S proteasome regulatory subunit N10